MTATPEAKPLLAVGYNDVGIVLRTRGGAEVTMPADDATALADALVQAVQDFAIHQALIAEVDDIDSTDEPPEPPGMA